MPVTLAELLEQHHEELTLPADDAAKTAAVDALKKFAQPVYQMINNLAFGAGQAKKQDEVTAAEARAQAALEKVTKLEADLRTAQDKAPDVATINQQWETKLGDE